MARNDASQPRKAVVVLDFGSQYNQLIARRVRQLGVYCEILPCTAEWAEIERHNPVALVLTGGPSSVLQRGAPRLDPQVLECGLPILGICYGMQLLSHMVGGQVEHSGTREYGPAVLEVDVEEPLFVDCSRRMDVWMSHGDQVVVPPDGFEVLAHTRTCSVAAMGNAERRIYGVQFHPEVVHTPQGLEVFRNFLFGVAGCSSNWTMSSFIEEETQAVRELVGDDRIICALSGGVDSTVVAALLHRAVGDQSIAVFVDNGLLRKGEAESVRRFFRSDFPLNLRFVDASERFMQSLAGVTDPEEKRKVIGQLFIDIFREEAKSLGEIRFLAQGTLYPDVIESVSAHGGPSATIKSHHNVGGLPDDLEFELIEPLRELFKDEVRELGQELGLPESVVRRQPFPGPGLAVRIIGEVTPQRIAVLREADQRVTEELQKYEGYADIWQSFAVLLPVKTVGVMGDGRTYANVVALRIVSSLDGMTSDWVKLPYNVLGRISSRIINEVEGVNRVVYDISPKPPSTIEWE